MASSTKLAFVCTLLAFFFVQISSSTDPPAGQSPSPEPSPDDAQSLSPPLPSPSPSPSDSPLASPPAPLPSDLTVPGPAPVGSPEQSEVPAPAPTETSDINHSNNVEASGDGGEESKGMSGGKKAGIVVGVIVAACLVGLGGLVYKKRQENVRRSDYSYAARRELL